MPSVARCLKVARLAVQHLGPPLVRGVVSIAGGVVATMVVSAALMRENDGSACSTEADDNNTWNGPSARDLIENRQPGDLFYGTDF